MTLSVYLAWTGKEPFERVGLGQETEFILLTRFPHTYDITFRMLKPLDYYTWYVETSLIIDV